MAPGDARNLLDELLVMALEGCSCSGCLEGKPPTLCPRCERSLLSHTALRLAAIADHQLPIQVVEAGG